MPKISRPSSLVLEQNSYRLDAGTYASNHSVKDAKKVFSLPSSIIKYWKKKVDSNLTLHNGKHGGHRYYFILH